MTKGTFGEARRPWVVMMSILAVAGMLIVTACGSSSSTTSASPSSASGKPSYCADLTSLQESVKALGQVKVVQNGTQALKTAASKVKMDAQALEVSVKGEFSGQIKAVKDSVDQLAASAKDLAASPSSATVSKLKSQVSAVKTSVTNFAGAASAKCG